MPPAGGRGTGGLGGLRGRVQPCVTVGSGVGEEGAGTAADDQVPSCSQPWPQHWNGSDAASPQNLGALLAR